MQKRALKILTGMLTENLWYAEAKVYGGINLANKSLKALNGYIYILLV